MNWIDRAIATVDPVAALKRVQARRALDIAGGSSGKRDYDGATKGRRAKNWRARSTSATTEILGAAQTLRDRSRDLVRNDAYAKRGMRAWVENAVGEGIVPEPDTGKDRTDRQIRDAFEEWALELDADGMSDFYGLQALACETVIQSGDALTRRRRRRSSDGLSVPLQIQLIEPDHLDRLKLKNGGNRVVAGIELDALNKRQAYWLYPEHPGDVGLGLTASLRNGAVRVPADQVAHLYRRSRPGQLTGVPWLAPVMLDLRDLGDYEQAEAVRKKIEACFAAFVTTQDSDDPRTLGAESTDDDGRLETIEPGLIEYLEQGEDIKFAQPTSNGSYGEYTRQRLHKIATGLDMPYIVLTGDVSQTNYSSYRAGLIQFQRAVRQFQRQVLIPGFCRPVWSWFIESAFAAGRIGEMNTRVKWTLPQFESVDRQKEALADLIEVRMGKTPMPEIIRRSGGDPGRVLAEIEKWLTLIDAKGLVLDSDPRKVTRAGVSQFSDPRLLDGEPDTDAVTTE